MYRVCVHTQCSSRKNTYGGDGTTFYADARRDGHYTQYLQGNGLRQNALWGDGVVFRGDGTPPHPPSTRVLFIHDERLVCLGQQRRPSA